MLSKGLTLLLFAAVAALGSTSAPAQLSGKPDRGAALSNSLQWQARVAKAKVGPDDPVFVVIHSSRDCPHCTRWKQDPSGVPVARVIASRYPKVRIFFIERDYLGADERQSQYPPELQFEYERRRASDGLSPGVPLFEVFLNGQIVFRAGGLTSWVDRVVPAIVSLEKRRPGAEGDVSAAGGTGESSSQPMP